MIWFYCWWDSLKSLPAASPFLSGSSDWVNIGEVTIKLGALKDDATFRLGQQSWHHLKIGSIKMKSPSDWVHKDDVTFRLGQQRWRHLYIWKGKGGGYVIEVWRKHTETYFYINWWVVDVCDLPEEVSYCWINHSIIRVMIICQWW